jgi:hypothetical protein
MMLMVTIIGLSVVVIIMTLVGVSVWFSPFLLYREYIIAINPMIVIAIAIVIVQMLVKFVTNDNIPAIIADIPGPHCVLLFSFNILVIFLYAYITSLILNYALMLLLYKTL